MASQGCACLNSLCLLANYFSLGRPRHGVAGRAFLVSSKNRRVCVVKCFFSKDKSNAEIELRNWTVVYGKTYPVRIQKLLTHNCLLVRYFSFISPELRRLYLPKVRKCLQQSFVCNQMKHNDVKW